MKITNRIVLGIIAGLGGTIAKNLVMEAAQSMNRAEFDGIETSAGMLLPGRELSSTEARVAGYFGNAFAGSVLGVATTYLLTMTGKNNALVKGSAVGLAAWLSFHGLFASFWGNFYRPAIPKDMLSQFVGHSVFGAVTGLIATGLDGTELMRGNNSIDHRNKSARRGKILVEESGNGKRMVRRVIQAVNEIVKER